MLALELDAPLDGWIARLDACLERSPAFFSRKSVVVDLSALELDRSGVAGLVENLSGRGIRIMALTGVEPAWDAPDLPPILIGGSARAIAHEPDSESADAAGRAAAAPIELGGGDQSANSIGGAGEEGAKDLARQAPLQRGGAALVVETTVRSGQSVYYPEGDVIVIGSVASGADVIAGGSVHIYGTLRGRVMAGVYGEERARIFCRRLEAELLAVGGFYLTADEIEPRMRSQAIQAWLENETVKIATLDK